MLGPMVPILQPLHSITEAAQPAHDGGRGVVVLELLWTGAECLKKYFQNYVKYTSVQNSMSLKTWQR